MVQLTLLTVGSRRVLMTWLHCWKADLPLESLYVRSAPQVERGIRTVLYLSVIALLLMKRSLGWGRILGVQVSSNGGRNHWRILEISWTHDNFICECSTVISMQPDVHYVIERAFNHLRHLPCNLFSPLFATRFVYDFARALGLGCDIWL